MKKLAKVVTAAILFFMSAYPVETQERRAPVVAVKAGRVLDVRTGRYLEHQLIWIENGRVMQVGAETELASRVPKDARIVDLSRYTVLPGLIDAHTHLTFSPFFGGYRALAVSVPREALRGARNARVTLEAGFTTVRNVAANGYSDIALRDAINDGEVPRPSASRAGTATATCWRRSSTSFPRVWRTAFRR